VIHRVLLLALSLVCLGVAAAGSFMIAMPSPDRRAPAGLPPALGPERLEPQLRADVRALSEDIGERNDAHLESLDAAANWVEARLAETSSRSVVRLSYSALRQEFHNFEVSFIGSRYPNEIVVVGAHYDSARDCPAADDNASGVAGLLALASAFSKAAPARTIRLVAFANEEPPHFKKASMGSLEYAKGVREKGDQILAMLSLETIGYFRDDPGSQKYPAPLSLFYPSRGDFIALVGNVSSRNLVRRAVEIFRASSDFPAEGAALPGSMPGVGWSDHWSFWESGYAAVMVTDTAPFRNPNYHTPKDTANTLDYTRMAEVVRGVYWVVSTLAEEGVGR
jgi:hypothetical protein